ncbi:SEC-C metal-binding domain-containing protein [Xiamenia xianingshaonis]|uniref:SEC-C metal-binding domain-containing protein n=1 Tax=Xiamenia xianingshaonis TaxID=2682776 RepID=UPI0021BD8BE2|nr:SEC-C metal-binding domain-containing protein [Xiamenia xianingshaonis]
MDIIDKLAAGEWDAWTAIAYRIDNDSSKSQWDRDIYAEAKTALFAISDSVQAEDIEEMLGYFLWSFQTFRQLNHDIDSLLYGGIKGSTRVRSLILPLCSSLIEGCFVNLARALMCGLSGATGKNYRAQNDLQPLLEVLGKNGFDGLATIPNVGLRNAISHGGVMIKDGTTGCRVEYTFSRGGERFYEEISSGDLEHIALRYLDAISGLMLSFCTFFDDVQAEKLFPAIKDSFVRYMYLGFGMSDDDFICLDVFEASIRSQLSYAFSTTVSDDDALFEKAEALFPKMRAGCPEFENYSIAYSHPRMPGNFIRAKGVDIDWFTYNGKPPKALLCTIFRSKDILWFGASTEEINEYEAEYYRFPVYEKQGLKIYDVSDASGDDRKRLRANVFIGAEQEREAIIEAIREAVSWTKNLYNPPNPLMRVVHGEMAADCVYLNVYRDLRFRNRALLARNENFVCMVEYCPRPEFRLPDNNNYIAYLYHNSEWLDDELRILWRDRNHLTHTNKLKVGRNDLCPCGSGKKYKKCCGR